MVIFFRLIKEAIKSIYFYRGILAKALLIPFIVSCVLSLASNFLPNVWFLSLSVCLSFGVQVIFAITIHRVLLLGPDSVPEWGALKWNKRETWFLLHVIALIAIPALFIFLGIYSFLIFTGKGEGYIFGVISAIVLWVVGIYLNIRLPLVFPAIAIDRRIGLKESWKLTDKHEGLMILIGIMVPILFSIPMVLAMLFSFLMAGAFVQDSLIFNLIVVILQSLLTVFIIGALSVTYRFIMEKDKSN